MRVSKVTNWFVLLAFAACLTLASSWYGAVLYVRHYPNIIEYLEPVQLLRPDGQPIGPISSSRPTVAVMHGEARRQPFYCWGSYVYYLDGKTAMHQFPIVRSVGLSEHVHEILIRHVVTIPAGLPVGTYRLKVTIYPSCDGVDVRPSTIDLGTDIEVQP